MAGKLVPHMNNLVAETAGTPDGALILKVSPTPATNIDGTPPGASSATLSNVASSTSAVTILAANANRKGFLVVNDGTATLYLKFGTAAAATSFTVKLSAGQTYESQTNNYKGIVTGLWDTANGAARVTELL